MFLAEKIKPCATFSALVPRISPSDIGMAWNFVHNKRTLTFTEISFNTKPFNIITLLTLKLALIP